MTQQIGKVCLDLSKYPGEDFYCDGAVEDEILEIAKNCSPVEFQRVIEERMSWPILYHLSSLRENIEDSIIDVGTNIPQDLIGYAQVTKYKQEKQGVKKNV